jgi:predicted regulator of Ras-like GTPase activity (Roadblock/LC7/MglB family)
VKDILARLCRVPGISGTMMVSADGLLVASQTSLGGRESEEAAAAVAGNLARGARTAIERLGRGELKHLTVSGPGGRAVLVASGSGYLVALVGSEANLGLVQLEIAAAAVEASRKMIL